MKLLLDTHALLWWWADDPSLSAAARAAINDESNEIFVSAASAWEIATKHRIGKLPGADQALQRFDALLQADGFKHLNVSYLHAIQAGSFTAEHRDPFDRMLAAQSAIENLQLVTLDAAFVQFGVNVFW